MTNRRHLLMISYFFPPMAGAGVFRALKFAKYLPEYNWLPHVITAKGDSSYETDPAMLGEVPAEVTVEAANYCWGPSRLLKLADFPGVQRLMSGLKGHPLDAREVLDRRLVSKLYVWQIPDSRYGWVNPAYKAAINYLQKKPVDVIYTTSAPFSSHLVGYKIKKKIGLPWVADFRDEWAKNPYVQYPTFVHRWINHIQERITVKNADLVLSVSQPITDLLRNGDKKFDKYRTIPNGFDPADFENLVAGNFPKTGENKFVLGYGGAFYSLRTPQVFIDAVESAFDKGNLPPEKILLRFWGYTSGYEFKNPVYKDQLENLGYLSHTDSLCNLALADVLVLLMPLAGGNRTYPGKLFEYLAARRPILALVPEGVAADLIRKARAGIVVPPENSQEIQTAILTLYKQWQTNQPFQPNEDVIQRYDRRRQSGQLASWLDELVKEKRRDAK